MEESFITKILITAKTYPSLSRKNIETVCTAGIREDGTWIRIYPILYRMLEKERRFRKYQWVQAEIIPSHNDPRPESFHVVGAITPLNILGTADGWKARKENILKNIYINLEELINEARNPKISTSLAVFKAERITGFCVKECKEKHEVTQKRKMLIRQIGKQRGEKLAEYVPYKFYYSFVDVFGKKSRLQILDWEIYQLCRKLMRKYGNRKDAIYRALREKYFDEIACKRDIYLFLGTTKHWHIRRSSNPFVIIGVFYPPLLNL